MSTSPRLEAHLSRSPAFNGKSRTCASRHDLVDASTCHRPVFTMMGSMGPLRRDVPLGLLGSTVRINGLFHLLKNGIYIYIYWGEITHNHGSWVPSRHPVTPKLRFGMTGTQKHTVQTLLRFFHLIIFLVINTVDGGNPKQPPFGCINLVNNGINYQPQQVIAGFLNHQQFQLQTAPFGWNASSLNVFRPVTQAKTYSFMGIGMRPVSVPYMYGFWSRF